MDHEPPDILEDCPWYDEETERLSELLYWPTETERQTKNIFNGNKH